MSVLKEALFSGELKKVCDNFVDVLEDMFDCSVDSINIHILNNEDMDLNVIMKKEI